MHAVRVATACSIVVGAALVPVSTGFAQNAGNPFYLVPSPTGECRNVSNCVAVNGPWVVVPAKGTATFLLSCPVRRGFIVGGTDCPNKFSRRAGLVRRRARGADRVSAERSQAGRSSALPRAHDQWTARRVPADPRLRLAHPDQQSRDRVVPHELVAARDGSEPASRAAGEEHRAGGARLVHVHGYRDLSSVHERLVGSWQALAFSTIAPPAPSYFGAASVTVRGSGNEVRASFRVSPRLLVPLAPLALAQIGAMCLP